MGAEKAQTQEADESRKGVKKVVYTIGVNSDTVGAKTDIEFGQKQKQVCRQSKNTSGF